MDEVELLIRMAQMTAIEEQKAIVMDVYDNTKLVIRYYVGAEVIDTMQLPEGMEFHVSTPNPRLHFRVNGNLQSFGSMAFYYEEEMYGYKINIGKGRLTRDD